MFKKEEILWKIPPSELFGERHAGKNHVFFEVEEDLPKN